jgi:hypothetical protein
VLFFGNTLNVFPLFIVTGANGNFAKQHRRILKRSIADATADPLKICRSGYYYSIAAPPLIIQCKISESTFCARKLHLGSFLNTLVLSSAGIDTTISFDLDPLHRLPLFQKGAALAR